MKLMYLILILLTYSVATATVSLKNITPSDTVYYIRLNTGDELIGTVKELVSSQEESDGIKFKTEIGTATIYDFQIAELIPYKNFYRQGNRVFLLPTGEPIGNNHYIANYELIMMQFGFGVSDFFSITGSATLLPSSLTDNLQNLNAKFTLYQENYESMEGRMSVAVGANYAYLRNQEYFAHLYGVSTFRGERSALSLSVLYKLGNNDRTEVRFNNVPTFINYPNGAFGIALGLDSKFKNSNNLHFIGELWNVDITRPTNTGVLIGLRLANTKFSADFGLAIFTQPFIAPFTQFSWTPF